MKRVLVTGINGFVGKHLTHELVRRGCEVVGLAHEGPANTTLSDRLARFVQCDLTKQDEVKNLQLDDVDVIINLAGLANVGASFDSPDLYKRVNVDVLSIIGARIATEKLPIRIIAISTGAVYIPDQPMPLREDSLTGISSPYVESKLLMEKATEVLREKGVDCMVVRPFNHVGPGQGRGFLIPDLYANIAASDEHRQQVKVGNLKTKRDYTDVRDIARAYADLALTQSLKYHLYNVCSGSSLSGEEVLSALLEATDKLGRIKVSVDQDLIRPTDPMDIYGDYSRLKESVGWEPVIKFETTIRDFVDSTTIETA